ncbi:Sugar lactone lactonase YvrE [Limimonas halophila]|uniref:Sugar lactone lactonase YvrE n=1 Tax=Limimonas halophila TaxID=1082479 RepID=A0A1G7UX14_9PROT|nr:L-dopachrome tautomerase-related protein [Limimonas halophila]SDG51679.1 Sugar lactone lactonase YvrE [Limimonas halophila]
MIRALASVLAALAVAAVLPVSAAAQDRGLEVVAELEQPPGNVAVTPGGQVVFSQHQFYGPEHRVVTLTDEGVEPFPNETWATPPGRDGKGLHAVLGLVADQRGIVWMADNGAPQPRIVAWDTRRDRLHRVITLPRHAAPKGSFPNDLAVDPAHDALYLADFGGPEPALIVVDLETGHARRVLAGHETVVPEDVDMTVEGGVVTQGASADAEPARVGVNPIAIDPSNTWVYYGAMNGTKVYRVRAADLLDAELSREELAARIQTYGDKPVSDGITIDADGNVYITDLGHNAVGVTRPDGTYDRLIRDDRLLWPDGFAMGPDGHAYVTVNQLHRAPFLNKGKNTAEPPYYVMRFEPVGRAVVGR